MRLIFQEKWGSWTGIFLWLEADYQGPLPLIHHLQMVQIWPFHICLCFVDASFTVTALRALGQRREGEEIQRQQYLQKIMKFASNDIELIALIASFLGYNK